MVQDAEDITAAEDRRLLLVAGEIVANATTFLPLLKFICNLFFGIKLLKL